MHERSTNAARDPDDRSGEAGQTMVEYAVILSVITVMIMAAIVAIGDSSGGLIEQVAAILS